MSDQASTPIAIDVPLRFIVKELERQYAGLCCPVCGSEFVHPLGVTVEQGRTRTEITGAGTTVVPTHRDGGSRGSHIELAFACEESHEFRYAFDFHKGSTLLQLSAQSFDAGQPTNELWRN